jgi:hypothetical protein
MPKSIPAALFLTSATVANATEAPPAMIDFARTQFEAWINVPEVLAVVAAQNERNSAITQREIDLLDATWRAQTRRANRPMIEAVMNNALSQYLNAKALETKGIITEVFVMDRHGLNVGQNILTSDYWQGDEDKYLKTYMVGPDAVHASDITRDESTELFQGQVSFPLTDADGAVIGVATIGMQAHSFF